jgi:hypothetical protein
MEHMDATHTTAPSACTSPGADATPPSATPAAGVQTERAVVAVDLSEPLDTLIPTAVGVAFADGTVAVYTVYLDDGVAVGSSGTTTLPYCFAPWPENTTVEQDEAAERAITAAWLAQREAA